MTIRTTCRLPERRNHPNHPVGEFDGVVPVQFAEQRFVDTCGGIAGELGERVNVDPIQRVLLGGSSAFDGCPSNSKPAFVPFDTGDQCDYLAGELRTDFVHRTTTNSAHRLHRSSSDGPRGVVM